MAKYKVLRRHDGEREYHEGDTRTAEPSDVKHLIDLGVLRLIKAEPASDNRAEPKLINKAAV